MTLLTKDETMAFQTVYSSYSQNISPIKIAMQSINNLKLRYFPRFSTQEVSSWPIVVWEKDNNRVGGLKEDTCVTENDMFMVGTSVDKGEETKIIWRRIGDMSGKYTTIDELF